MSRTERMLGVRVDNETLSLVHDAVLGLKLKDKDPVRWTKTRFVKEALRAYVRVKARQFRIKGFAKTDGVLESPKRPRPKKVKGKNKTKAEVKGGRRKKRTSKVGRRSRGVGSSRRRKG